MADTPETRYTPTSVIIPNFVTLEAGAPPLVKVKVKVSTLDIAPLRGTPPQKRSGTDHTVLPTNFTVPASTS